MTSQQEPINPDDIFARTADGSQASFDTGRPLSAGFREMLKALDGRRTVQQLAAKFPKLDQEDILSWLEELRRMQLIEIAEIPFELPELKITPPAGAKAAAKPAAAQPKPAATGEINFDEMAANVADWVKESTESFTKVRPAELNKTIQMATLQSSQALENLEDSGFIANLMEPINFNEPEPAARPAPAAAGQSGKPRQAPPAATASQTARLRQTPPTGAAVAPPPRKKTALVFEDDAADLKELAQLIKAAGYEVHASSTRQEFVSLLNGNLVPDVMFLKLGAKDVDGFKALEKLRLHPRLKEVAVVMMAPKPSREDIAKSILLGASGWVIKPYSADVITAAVQGVLAFPVPHAGPLG